VLASCAKEEVVAPGEQEEEEEVVTPGEEEEEEEVVVPKAGEPQYGGKVIYFYQMGTSAGGADMVDMGRGTGIWYATAVVEHLMRGNVEKYGPRGTNEYGFGNSWVVPYKFLTGALAESWDLSIDSIVFHIRPGVYWTGESINPGVMEGPREYTADDCVFNLRRLYNSPRGSGLVGAGFIKTPVEKTIYAADKYTVVIETSRYNSEWWWLLNGWGTDQYPPEVVEAGAMDYNNLIGTGPWIMKEYVPSSYVSFKRNPNYWRKTTINGKEYEIPFIDELVNPVIADESTVIAALRTGKIDLDQQARPVYMESLPSELLTAPVSGFQSVFSMRADKGPFADKKIRQAAMMGADLPAIAKAVYTEAYWYSWPVSEGSPGYIPLEELPASTRELYKYNPKKAREIILDAYPDGFTVEVTTKDMIDLVEAAEMLSAQWSKIGITLKINVIDYSAFSNLQTTYGGWGDMIMGGGMPSLPLTILRGSYGHGGWGGSNGAMWFDESFIEKLNQASETIDPVELDAILRELNLITKDECLYIPIGEPIYRCCWWPWIKNYWGEVNDIGITQPPMAQVWLDKDLKAKMGY